MRWPEEIFALKDGKLCALRSPEPTEAARRIAFLRCVNGETDFMARSADDSPSDVGTVADMIAEQLDDERTLEIAAWTADGEMIACGGISPVSRSQPRRAHRAQLGIAVLRKYWGQGIGGSILERLIEAAPELGFLQIELTVAEGNERAIGLYRRFGFRETGRTPRALRYEDGTFADEICMVLEV